MRSLKVIFCVVIVSGLFLSACDDGGFLDSVESFDSMNDLYIPPLIDSRLNAGGIAISIQEGAHEFFEGRPSQTRGFNGDYLGPTIRMYKNEDTRIQFTNNIGEPTTVHGHGLHVPGNVDGGPQSRIEPGATWDVTLPIRQEASTNWYHPHLMGKTAEHVHSGLAGFYLVEDDNSQSLNLPNNYGEDDIPLIIQDRTFSGGQMLTHPGSAARMQNGLREPTLVVNGTVDPYLTVANGNVRLRLLNGSNARSYEFFLSDNQPFYKIATEGGFLNSPVQLTRLSMAPGERNEIVIDMSTGDVELMAYFLRPNSKTGGAGVPRSRVLYLRVDESLTPQNTSISQNLNNIQRYNTGDVVRARSFELEDMEINDRQMDMRVINERVKLGDLEKWEIDSRRHPFHMHGVSFLILSVNGRTPAPEDQGWKDTMMPYGDAEVLLRFEFEAGDDFPYMYHCHLLEHEDAGMMGQFTVKP